MCHKPWCMDPLQQTPRASPTCSGSGWQGPGFCIFTDSLSDSESHCDGELAVCILSKLHSVSEDPKTP